MDLLTDTRYIYFFSGLGWHVPGLSELPLEKRLLLLLAERSGLYFLSDLFRFVLLFRKSHPSQLTLNPRQKYHTLIQLFF